MRLSAFAAAVFLLALPSVSFCWDGHDTSNGDYVHIEDYVFVVEGEVIEVYDSYDDHNHNVKVETIDYIKSGVMIYVFDPAMDDYRVFEMERLSTPRMVNH